MGRQAIRIDLSQVIDRALSHVNTTTSVCSENIRQLHRRPDWGSAFMDFIELTRNRRSVRSYRRSKLDPPRLTAIMEAARAAPSAGNLQSYRVAAVEEPRLKAALASAAGGQQFIEEAALILVFFADPERSAARYGDRGRALFALQDATIAAAYAQLATASLGLASCWVGAFDEEEVIRALSAPAGLRPVAMLPIGEAAEAPRRPARRRIDALLLGAGQEAMAAKKRA